MIHVEKMEGMNVHTYNTCSSSRYGGQVDRLQQTQELMLQQHIQQQLPPQLHNYTTFNSVLVEIQTDERTISFKAVPFIFSSNQPLKAFSLFLTYILSYYQFQHHRKIALLRQSYYRSCLNMITFIIELLMLNRKKLNVFLLIRMSSCKEYNPLPFSLKRNVSASCVSYCKPSEWTTSLIGRWSPQLSN